jgi:MFS family permease
MQDSREKATVPEQREGIHGTNGISDSFLNIPRAYNLLTSEDSGDWRPKKQDYHILGSLALVSLVVALDSTILITSLPAISRDLGGTATEAFWAATSYLLTYAVLQPVIASLSDAFGRRKSLFVSVLLFTIGSLIACLAKNFACLLAGRTIQGIGGGGVMVLVLVIATDVIPLRCLPKYQGIVQIAWAIGTMSGPLIGGVFAQLTTWRWVFYINFPICGIGLLLVLFTIPKGVLAGTAKGGAATIDVVGAAMLVASFTTFLVAITLGGTTFPWGTVHIILPLVIGILGIAATFVWELLGARAPILRPSLFLRRFSTVPYICAFIQGFLVCRSHPEYLECSLTWIAHGYILLLRALPQCCQTSHPYPNRHRPVGCNSQFNPRQHYIRNPCYQVRAPKIVYRHRLGSDHSRHRFTVTL